ncbi:hypothetical protein F511_25149 [Dorcoceras hygrometricum]|uniref:Uncharacterized protein n=1 Tax=Dorcoceras hygrometricum TaxID=472368 RepID=A0A2Z7CR45_9LAMI|nr:hypothetical protein F511_25149 [Dorcoceras hygrometricum]
MASSFYTNTLHVDFESVLAMDNPDMVSVDGLVVITVNGVPVEITEQLFAEAFELPVDGLSKLSEIPKDKVFDARSLVSLTDYFGENIKIPGVDERTWYLASLPQIPVDDKVKEPLMEKDPVKGNPVKEQFLLILADIECLVQLREKVIDEELKDQSLAHGLRWEKTCCSKLFEWRTRDRGAVIARSNTITKSSCWIRTMLRGTWVIEPCADYWKPIPREVSSSPVVIPSRLSYVDTLPPVSEFFKVMTKRWSDVCLEVIKFFASRRLLPVGSINFCRALSVVEPVNSFVLHQPTVFSLRLSQFCTVFSRYSLFSRLRTEDIHGFFASIASARTALRSVQTTSSSAVSPHILSVADTDFVAQRVPMVLDQRPFSSSSSDESIHFDDHDTAATAFSLPAAATPDITEALALLRASIEQIRNRVDDAKLKDTIILHLLGIEQRFTACLDDQDRVLGALRKDSHNQKQLLSLDIKSSQKQLSAQAAAAAFDTVDVRRVAKELDANVTYLDGQVASTRNDLLEFRATAQETLNHIADQLSELIAYINRGGNDKKGEVSSSSPQPPPDDQNRGSGKSGGGGDNVRTTNIVDRYSGSMSR